MANEESDAPVVDAPEPLDEVLQQTSEQTPKLAHIDDVVNEVRGSANDLAEAMHAGFIELRAVTHAVAQKPVEQAASSGLDPTTLHLLGDRLDEIERAHRRAATRERMLLIVAFIQLIVIGVLAALAFGVSSGPQGEVAAATAVVAPAPTPSAVTPVVESPPAVEPAAGTKRNRRRH